MCDSAFGFRKRKRREPEDFGDNPDPLQCCYYMERKHRFCRMERKQNSRLCATHHMKPQGSFNDVEEDRGVIGGSIHKTCDGRAPANCIDTASCPTFSSTVKSTKEWERVPCLINPNHTVYACRLAKHIKVCPDLRFITCTLPYYWKDKHAFRNVISPTDPAPLPSVSSFTTVAVMEPFSSTSPTKIESKNIETDEEDVVHIENENQSPRITSTSTTTTAFSTITSRIPQSSSSSFIASSCCSSCNSYSGVNEKTNESSGTPHKNLPPDQLASLIEKVRQCYDNYVEPRMFFALQKTHFNDKSGVKDVPLTFSEGNSKHTGIPLFVSPEKGTNELVEEKNEQEELEDITEMFHKVASHIGEEGSMKHTPQHIALLQMMDCAIMKSSLPGLQKPLDGVLELGAGKGGLSIALQRLLTTFANEIKIELPSSLSCKGSSISATSFLNSSILAARFPFLTHQWKTSQSVAASLSPSVSITSQNSSSSFFNFPTISVIDVQTFRRKGDSKVCHSVLPIHRLRVDLKDLYLTKAFLCGAITGTDHTTGAPQEKTTHYEELQPNEGPSCVISVPSKEEALKGLQKEKITKQWVAVGKHLCGAATEFALSCLAEPELQSVANVAFRAVVIATCCHHRCEYVHMLPPSPSVCTASTPQSGDSICNSSMTPAAQKKEKIEAPPHCDSTALPSSHEQQPLALPGTDFTLNQEEFAAVASMTSWAVGGKNVDTQKQRIGYLCKRIIDSYRVAYLRSLGFDAYLATYIPRFITEENVCIVAFK